MLEVEIAVGDVLGASHVGASKFCTRLVAVARLLRGCASSAEAAGRFVLDARTRNCRWRRARVPGRPRPSARSACTGRGLEIAPCAAVERDRAEEIDAFSAAIFRSEGSPEGSSVGAQGAGSSPRARRPEGSSVGAQSVGAQSVGAQSVGAQSVGAQSVGAQGAGSSPRARRPDRPT